MRVDDCPERLPGDVPELAPDLLHELAALRRVDDDDPVRCLQQDGVSHGITHRHVHAARYLRGVATGKISTIQRQ